MQELISYYYAPVATISIFAIWKLYKVFNKGFKVIFQDMEVMKYLQVIIIPSFVFKRYQK